MPLASKVNDCKGFRVSPLCIARHLVEWNVRKHEEIKDVCDTGGMVEVGSEGLKSIKSGGVQNRTVSM